MLLREAWKISILLLHAMAHVEHRLRPVVEGYPVSPGARLYTYLGPPSTFRSAGFGDATPPGATPSFMRYFF